MVHVPSLKVFMILESFSKLANRNPPLQLLEGSIPVMMDRVKNAQYCIYIFQLPECLKAYYPGQT